jgi:ankyrin repeat protein
LNAFFIFFIFLLFLNYKMQEEEKDKFSLVFFLLGSCGYEEEADRIARVSTDILTSWQIVEGISRFQFSETRRTRLMYAAKTGNLERLNFIADLGARVNMTTVDNYRWGKLTALHFASDRGHTECVRALLDRAAVIDAQDESHQTALHLACCLGHLDIVRLLCERGAQIDLQGKWERTALYCASFYNKIDIVRYLCERGANTLLKCNGDNPYAYACRYNGIDSPIALFLEAYPH